ncbi:MAG: hypothetical protein EBS85_04560 [Micrococcales bacterium]|nr:hypothetical protein [Actinomycetota bacterium]NCA07982.1 hypothetical protein [Micrococcales bacterium]
MKKSLIALTAAIALATPAAMPAFAYPAGSAPTLGLSTVSRIVPGGNVSVIVSRVKKNCSVTLSWSGVGGDTATGVVRATGKTSVLSIATPTNAGVYTLTTNTISSSCSGGDAVALTKSITVGKLASVVGKLATSSAYVSKNPTVTASGTIKSGSVSVANADITVVLKKNGSTVRTVHGSTNGSGAYSLSVGADTGAGAYTAVVTLDANTVYVGSSVTTAALNLR